MISGGPDPLFVKAMMVPSREVVVRFSPIDFTARPPEYRIASMPTAAMATTTTTVIRFMRPPALPLARFCTICVLDAVPAFTDSGKVGSEVLQRFGRAGIDAHLEHGVAFSPGRALHRYRQPGFL